VSTKQVRDTAERAAKAFNRLDLDANKEITKEEFIKCCLANEDLYKLITNSK
jgi:Ca2+-binding EF-hand superfamily protein